MTARGAKISASGQNVFDWGVQETWLLSEFCDKGNLDRAVSGGRFHDKATGAPEMVRTPKASQQYLS